MYQGLQDALAAGENDSGTIDRRTILHRILEVQEICTNDTKMQWL